MLGKFKKFWCPHVIFDCIWSTFFPIKICEGMFIRINTVQSNSRSVLLTVQNKIMKKYNDEFATVKKQ